MKEYLQILKIATSNKNYPPYASYLHSDGKKIYTCNLSESVCIDYKAPFVGDINFFVLNGILNKSKEALKTAAIINKDAMMASRVII